MPIIAKTLDFLLNPIVKYVGSKRFKVQEIAADALITPEWTEFPIEPPVKIEKPTQKISLEIECEQDLNQKDFFSRLPDGTIIKPEIQIVDEFENIYNLEGGESGGLFHKTKPDIFVAHSLGFSSYPDKLPTDRRYKKIRIRNEQSFLCPKIEWVDYQMK